MQPAPKCRSKYTTLIQHQDWKRNKNHEWIEVQKWNVKSKFLELCWNISVLFFHMFYICSHIRLRHLWIYRVSPQIQLQLIVSWKPWSIQIRRKLCIINRQALDCQTLRKWGTYLRWLIYKLASFMQIRIKSIKVNLMF